MSLNHQYYKDNVMRLVGGQLPKNRKQFYLKVLDNSLQQGMFGYFDPEPREGKVIFSNDEAFIMLDNKNICVVDRSLVTFDPETGDTVQVRAYARRDFDGYCVTGPKPETRTMSNGTTYVVESTILGGRAVKLPVPEAKCYELKSLIELLETDRLPDGFRHLTHMLVDAQARDFEIVDPVPDDIFRTPPAVSFSVNTRKHCGRVRVFYNRGLDSFGIELLQDGERTYFDDYVLFNELGTRLHDLIDDGAWNRIDVDLIAAAKKPRKAKQLAQAA
ncbi:MAG: GTPase [Proteobacteria bacterium]|nr:GTPase [Pseudomonadota bacterium]